MSALARSAMSARLSKLPAMPPMPPGSEDLEENEDDALGDLPLSSTPKSHAPRTTGKFDVTAGAPRDKNPTGNPFYAPISASAFFAQAIQVDVPTAGLDVRAYHTPPKKGLNGKGILSDCSSSPPK